MVPRRSRIFVVCGDELLLIKSWLGNDSWGLTGGGAKRNEHIVQCALRELNEEVGIKAKPHDLVELGDFLHTKNGHRYRAYFFILNLNKKPVLHLQKHEISEAVWINKKLLSTLKLNKDTEQGLSKYTDKVFE
jgi:8-oxo-dGTP pyrophosphatase MutT (NUDIX family)